MSFSVPMKHPVWEKLLTRKVQHKFSLFAANVAVEHAARDYEKNASDKDRLISELHGFFAKYDKLVSAEFAKIM